MTTTNPSKNETMNEQTNYQRLTREGQRLDDKLARYMSANGLDLDGVQAEIENKTCRLPSRVRQYVNAYFRVNEYETKQNEQPSKPE
jgi:glutamate-1-semialdehyde aminotransferase